MRQIWLNENECVLDGVPFHVGSSDYGSLKTSLEKIFVLKGKGFFDRYDTYFGNQSPRNVLEVGIFEGGSAMLLADKWPEAKIVGIDIRDPNPAVHHHVEQFGFGKRIALHYNVSQNDPTSVAQIINKEFAGPIDVVIDDASHLYQLTKQCFNIVFPFLKRCGIYCVEDWGWAHWRDWQQGQHAEAWKDHPALTNLLFDLTIACASSSFLISDVYTNSNFFAVRKAEACPNLTIPFNLDKHCLTRGKEKILI